MNQRLPAPHDAFPAVATPTELPLVAIQRLGRRTTRDGMYVGLILALLGHVAAVGSPDYTMWMMHVAVGKMNRELKAYFERTEEVEVLDEKEKEKEDEKPEVKPEPVPVEADEAPEPDPTIPPPPAPDTEPEEDPYDDPEPYEPPAPEAAEAQDVLTANDGVVDMTGDGFDIHDNDGSTSRATGATGKTGRKEGHVSNPNASPTGTGTGTGTGRQRPPPPPPARPKKDMSRPVKVLGGISNCPFPSQADLNQVDRAVVVLSVTVGSNGRAKRASVVSDPGYGFGARARTCAMNGRYAPARNRDGKKISKPITLRVRFTR